MPKHYLVCTTDPSVFITRAILWFSKLAKAPTEYDHVLLGRGDLATGYLETYDLAFPKARYLQRLGITAPIYTIYEVLDDNIGHDAWLRAKADYGRGRRYSVGQLVTMSWSVITRKPAPIRVGAVCSEAVASWLLGRHERWMDIYTVGQTMEQLQIMGIIRKVS